MSSKIRVDPRTFKIINLDKEIKSQPQTPTTTETETFTSDQESSTSVNSDNESVKVIKLDSTEKAGGQPPQPQPKPQVNSNNNNNSSSISTNSAITNPNINKNLFNYLNTNPIPSTSSAQSSAPPGDLGETTTSISKEPTVESDNSEEQTLEQQEQQEQTQEQQEDTSQDVFDLTQNKLYQVLSKLFEDNTGNNISDNIEKMSKLFETHNQIMDKILNQLIIMNTNYKQVKGQDPALSSTKKAGNVEDFRKKLEQLEPKPLKRD